MSIMGRSWHRSIEEALILSSVALHCTLMVLSFLTEADVAGCLLRRSLFAFEYI
jgi:hypothetical protein